MTLPETSEAADLSLTNWPLLDTERIDACKELLEKPRDLCFLKRIITSDEKWIFFQYPNLRKQWLSKGQLVEPVADI